MVERSLIVMTGSKAIPAPGGGKAARAVFAGAVGVLLVGGCQHAGGPARSETTSTSTSTSTSTHPIEPVQPPVSVADPADPEACADGNACMALADQLAKTDPQRSLAAFLRACEMKDRTGCYNAALQYQEGHGVTKNLAKALATYLRGCELAGGRSCAAAAVYYAEGYVGGKDLARGFELSRRACELESANGIRPVVRPVPGTPGSASARAVRGDVEAFGLVFKEIPADVDFDPKTGLDVSRDRMLTQFDAEAHHTEGAVKVAGLEGRRIEVTGTISGVPARGEIRLAWDAKTRRVFGVYAFTAQKKLPLAARTFLDTFKLTKK